MISLIVGAAFIICGFILMKIPLKSINGIYGYRTSLAMKNRDTWDIAQKYGAYSMIMLGIVNGIFGIWATIQPLIVNGLAAQMIFLLIGAVLCLLLMKSI